MAKRRPRFKIPRFAILVIPGRRRDGRDASYFVHDRRNQRSEHVGEGATARELAVKATRSLNDGRTVARAA